MKAKSAAELEFEQAVARMRKHRPALRKRIKHTMALAKIDDRRVIVGAKSESAKAVTCA